MRDAIQRMQLERKLAAVFFGAVLLFCAILQSISSDKSADPPQSSEPYPSVQGPKAGTEVQR